MFFVASKVAFFLIAPSHLCLIGFAIGLVLLSRRATQKSARRVLMISFAGFVLVGFSPLGNALIYPLEQRFPVPAVDAGDDYSGIIVLGGFENANVSHARDTLALIGSAERISETVRLARRIRRARVIFTGGAVVKLQRGHSGAPAVGAYLRDVGIGDHRIVLEGASRNTWENAIFTKRLVQPAKSDRFLLVTSAWHMPRAIGVFRKAGYNVVAYPVDYRTTGASDLAVPFSYFAKGLRRTDKAVKEWIGLLVYWWTGRSSELLPAP